MFANQMYWGTTRPALKAASACTSRNRRRTSLEEAAMLAGIIQGNVRQSPYVNMDAAVRRRNYTGSHGIRGLHLGEQAEETKAKPIVVRGEPRPAMSMALFLEEVRKHLETLRGEAAVCSGLSVKTTLDPVLQDAANRAVAAGLRRLDKKRGSPGHEERARRSRRCRASRTSAGRERWPRRRRAGPGDRRRTPARGRRHQGARRATRPT